MVLPSLLELALDESQQVFLQMVQQNMFVTLFVAIVDIESGEFVYCNGGHPRPIIRRENGDLVDKNYERRAERFFDEFEWYVTALSAQRKKGTPY